jgi:flagellar biosynthesis protein FlhB
LDPSAGIQRVFSFRDSLVELAQGTAKLTFLGVVVGSELIAHAKDLPRLAAGQPSDVAYALATLVQDVVVSAAPVLVILSIADYGWAWWQFREKMMRTDQQVRDDAKDAEGDPRMKGIRRQRQREIALGQSLKRVAEADVIVTNPTHYAVALRYKRGKDQAPVVVAKGVDHVALKIRAEARRLGIAIVEDRVLARALHAKVKPGRAIPSEYYGAVARVLAVIWRRKAARSTQPRLI